MNIAGKQIRTVVSGITPSGSNLHIGNYFGAIRPHIELQDSVEHAYYFVADLHALTTVKNREELENNIKNVILDYLALGLDPEKVVFFRQSQVHAHSELAIILANYISYGQMQRMHAFKDKLQDGQGVENINMGLFNYPLLMASDILLYRPDAVPVGEDQRQHIELTRDIALSFNKTYGADVLIVPEPMINENKLISRVVGTDGTRKMSKSLGNVIGIFDDMEVIQKQIMGSYTDPARLRATDPGKVEGNPVFLYHDLLNINTSEVEDLKSRYRQGQVGDVEVKEKLINAHAAFFKNARERRKALEADPSLVREILESGSEAASMVAKSNLAEVRNLIGLSVDIFKKS